MLTYGHVVTASGTMVDECMAVIMRSPHSYTREDVCELQLHGGGYTANTVLQLCLEHGARLADAGEFTRRAFDNGRIDLSQAEAVMRVIAADGQKSHDAALRQLQGGTLQFIKNASDTLYSIQAGIAACIDYPEEVSEEETIPDIRKKLLDLVAALDNSYDEHAAKLMDTGLHVTICGRPNAGKSSLLNALIGEERAIVTNIPGTTRDTITADLMIDGVTVHLTDTAGLRDTTDTV